MKMSSLSLKMIVQTDYIIVIDHLQYRSFLTNHTRPKKAGKLKDLTGCNILHDNFPHEFKSETRDMVMNKDWENVISNEC